MDPFIGEIKLMAVQVVPQGWHLCDGTILQVSQNAALFSLLGNAYGGDGKTTFALPDLRGRTAVSVTVAAQRGANGGAEAVPLSTVQVPSHTHLVNVATTNGNIGAANGNHIAASGTTATPPVALNLYSSDTSNSVTLDPSVVTTSGSSLSHNNMQPFLAMNYYIATTGIYPSRP